MKTTKKNKNWIFCSNRFTIVYIKKLDFERKINGKIHCSFKPFIS